MRILHPAAVVLEDGRIFQNFPVVQCDEDGYLDVYNGTTMDAPQKWVWEGHISEVRMLTKYNFSEPDYFNSDGLVQRVLCGGIPA